MNKYIKTLVGITTTAVIFSTNVYADDFQTVLKNEQVHDKTNTAIISNHESNVWSMQSLIEENRIKVESKRRLQSEGIAGMKKSVTGWREVLGEPVKL
jgi:hypothetical protein